MDQEFEAGVRLIRDAFGKKVDYIITFIYNIQSLLSF